MEKIFQSGFANIIGFPNSGKSTLLNGLLGEPLAIITPKIQTTRHRILGIINDPNYQIVFSDTPGILTPHYALQKAMMSMVYEAIDDADVLIYLLNAAEPIFEVPKLFLTSKLPKILLVNKIDVCKCIISDDFAQQFNEKLEIVALDKNTLTPIIPLILNYLPIGEPYFDTENITDKDERFLVSEIIREQILLHYHKEIPYSVEIVVTKFEEKTDITRIEAIIYTERESQKNIIIGHLASELKHIGIQSRAKIESWLDKKIFLGLTVKVRTNWRNDEKTLQRFRYM